MNRIISSSLSLAVSLSVGLAWGQEFQIQLSENSALSFFNGNGDGAPMVFAPVPGLMPTTPENLINLPRVAYDLQLVDDQKEEIKDAVTQVREKYRKKTEALQKKLESAVNDGEREELNRELGEIQKRLAEELKESVEFVLLPFQRNRLQQIVAQSRLNNDGSNALQCDAFAKLLKLTKEQLKELEEKQAEMQERLREEIRDLRRKRQRELIDSVLTSEQKKQLEELLGDDLSPEQKDKKESGKSDGKK